MPKNDRPNILLIMSDQHSPHILGAYGNGIVRTPNLDALAANGIRFDNMYCPSPLCVPSRMSFLTGRTPTANRVWTNYHMLPSDIPTFAHALGGADYETALIGRMHFMGPDQRHGFKKRPLVRISRRRISAHTGLAHLVRKESRPAHTGTRVDEWSTFVVYGRTNVSGVLMIS